MIRAPPPGETSGSPVVDPAGKLLGFCGTDTDVTERKAAGGTAGSYFGSRRFPHPVIKRLLAVVLLIAGAKLIFTR